VPVHLVVPINSTVWQARADSDLFLAVAEVSSIVEGQVGLRFQQFPGPLPESALRLDPVSGRLDVKPTIVVDV